MREWTAWITQVVLSSAMTPSRLRPASVVYAGFACLKRHAVLGSVPPERERGQELHPLANPDGNPEDRTRLVAAWWRRGASRWGTCAGEAGRSPTSLPPEAPRALPGGASPEGHPRMGHPRRGSPGGATH